MDIWRGRMVMVVVIVRIYIVCEKKLFNKELAFFIN